MQRLDPERKSYRVVKTLRPTDSGALTLARKYGDALVCVRHRTDGRGKMRHITVELLVEVVPIRPRNFAMVAIRVRPQERVLHAMCKAAGGVWDGQTRTWQLPQRVAGILNLRDRIIHPRPHAVSDLPTKR